jgi:hypothetical protein
VKIGDLVEWDQHSLRPKAIVIGFYDRDDEFTKLLWLPNSRFSNAGKVSMVETRELKVIQ